MRATHGKPFSPAVAHRVVSEWPSSRDNRQDDGADRILGLQTVQEDKDKPDGTPPQEGKMGCATG